MNADVIATLASLVGAAHVRTDADSLVVYGCDRTTGWTPAPAAVVLPATIAEVQALVRLANEHHLAIVPSGGRTGLSGGAVAAKGEIVLSLERMNRIRAIDPVDHTLCCEAGVVTARVQQAAREVGFFYPVDFASSGSSQIGGNVATNAGGIRVLRYGSTREQVLGLKVVTGAGDLLDLNRGLVKNNCGPDLRHLFIASEGILGVICEVTLKLRAPPPSARVMVVGAADCALLLHVQAEARQRFALSAFEFFSRRALERVTAHTGLTAPLTTATPFYGLLEFDEPAGGEQAVLDFFLYCQERGWVDDGVIAHSERQAVSLWRLREDISESLAAARPLKHDIAVTLAKMPGFGQCHGGIAGRTFSNPGVRVVRSPGRWQYPPQHSASRGGDRVGTRFSGTSCHWACVGSCCRVRGQYFRRTRYRIAEEGLSALWARCSGNRLSSAHQTCF